MSATTGIEWTDATWNPVTGCTKVSAGCDHCYAETFAERWRGTAGHYFENGFDVELRPDKLDLPLKWRQPKRIFVNSMSDLFHDSVPDEYIAEVFAVMAAAPQHTFQVLTKRHARLRSLVGSQKFWADVEHGVLDQHGVLDIEWPLPNVWLGVSTENQQWADIRIPALLDTPAAVRFISAEPLLGPIYLPFKWTTGQPRIDWVIAGGESGRGARPMHPDWPRVLRDICNSADIPFLFKQWGEFRPAPSYVPRPSPAWQRDFEKWGMTRVGKKAAGRELDGRTWDEYPAVAS
jgi:protein gp37